MFNIKVKEIILLIFTPLALGMLGAILIQVFIIKNPPAIATVNISSLQDSFVRETAGLSLSQEAKQQKIVLFSQLLLHSINQIAQEKHATILLSEAVIAGNEDYTQEVANLIKKGMIA